MKLGVCNKCGKYGKIFMHHTKGYKGEHKDDVLPYCLSCHKQVHIEARKSGRCQIPVNELARLSRNSTIRRRQKESCKYICFESNLIPNVRLTEILHIYPTIIQFEAYFQATNGKKLYEINI